MTTPLVTLSLPTIGRLEFLPALKRAIAAQTFRDFELLVLDNACPPEARAQLLEWSKEDARVRHLPIDERVPMFANFNRGFTAARGRYFATLADDDLYAPEFLEQSVELLERGPQVGFVGSNVDFIDERGAVTERRRWLRADEVWRGRDYILRLMRAGRNPIMITGTVMRRSAMPADGFGELSPYYGDFIFLMRIAERHDVGFLKDPLLQIRRHEDQASLRFDHAKGYVLRTSLLRAYCEELKVRFSADPHFPSAVARAFERSNRKVSLWGWLTAPDEAAARECLEALGTTPLDGALQLTLRQLHRLGLDARRRNRLAPLVRRVGNAFRG